MLIKINSWTFAKFAPHKKGDVFGHLKTPFPDGRLRYWSAILKRPFDICFAIIAILFTSPLLLFCMIGVKLSSQGSIFFTQKRVGKDGKLFTIYKFRTMTHFDDEERDDIGFTTSFGRFMRRTSMDELPQFLNVLIGDMSVVGPRPHIPHMYAAGQRYDNLSPNYHLRHSVKPGITGLAQVNGFRGDVSEDNEKTRYAAQIRIHLDQHYIQRATLLLDIEIIFLTFFKEFIFGSGR